MDKQCGNIAFYVVERNPKMDKTRMIIESLLIWIKGIFPLLFLRSYQYERKYDIVTKYPSDR